MREGEDLHLRREQRLQGGEIEPALRDTPAGLQVRIGGTAAVSTDITSQVSEDIGRAEQISMPVVLVLLTIALISYDPPQGMVPALRSDIVSYRQHMLSKFGSSQASGA